MPKTRSTVESTAASPAASGPAGTRLEIQAGAFCLLSLLARGEPRGLPGATIQTVKFQQAAFGRPFDDVAIDAINADGSPAYLDIQSKRSPDFTKSDTEFGKVVQALWATSRSPLWADHRYETAVAIARTSTKIERDYQQVLDWARRVGDGATFGEHIRRAGFASTGMRDFADAFRFHLEGAGAPTDDETVWQLLRRFQILVFDFEAPGSDWQHRAHERARVVLSPEQASAAQNLWAVLCQIALEHDAAGGSLDRDALIRELAEKHGFAFAQRSDLRRTFKRLSESTRDALALVSDQIGGVSLSRSNLINAAENALDCSKFLQIVGGSGLGKSGLMKRLASRLETEGAVLFLSPPRIVGGGWMRMASDLDCPIDRTELFNELACGGAATLFVDNIDQVDDLEKWATLNDLLQTAATTQGWRVAYTVRSEDQDWREHLAPGLRALSPATITVAEISDPEAGELATANSALAALLRRDHPARAIARNPFFPSRMIALAPASADAAQVPANEADFATLWWGFGGGRSATDKFRRQKLLRDLGGQLVAEPGKGEFDPDRLAPEAIDDLLRADSLRESPPRAMLAFAHDTLRDWTVGFTLHDRPQLRDMLPVEAPLPGALARGLEIAARLALRNDPTGREWLKLVEFFERPGCHGSWRRPVLLALPHAENAFELFDLLKAGLLADKGQRLQAIVRHLLALETEPFSRAIERAGLALPVAKEFADGFLLPRGRSWEPLVTWLIISAEEIPSKLIPDMAKVFRAWLTVTRGQPPEFGSAIIEIIFGWLVRMDSALRPRFIQEPAEAEEHDLDFDGLRSERDDLRLTFFAFCEFRPDLAAAYLDQADTDFYHGAKEIITSPQSALKAAPASFVNFFLATVIPKRDEEDWTRFDNHGLRPFDIFDHNFLPLSPGQGPFLALLDSAPQEGLRLIRKLIEYATEWHRQHWAMHRQACPSITVPFLSGDKVFHGDFGIYQWARGGTGTMIASSALMALEAWAHRDVEAGRPVADVLEDVCGPSGSSIAFICVAADIVLSHWLRSREIAWPMLAVPELLYFDKMRFEGDASGLGRHALVGDEPAHWPIKRADLAGRPSRESRLLDMIGNLTVFGPDDVHKHLRVALEAENQRLSSVHGEANQFPVLVELISDAFRSSDPDNWEAVRREGGPEIVGYKYRLAEDEQRRLQRMQDDIDRNAADVGRRILAQNALENPSESTPEIVRDVMTWAKDQSDDAGEDDLEDYDQQWKKRAVIMAAALAARDYQGSDRPDVEDWCVSILDRAAAHPVTDIGMRSSKHVTSNPTAIAVLGQAYLYCRDRRRSSLHLLLTLAARQDHGISNALGIMLGDLSRADDRVPRSLTRILLASVSHPRPAHDPELDASNAEQSRLKAAEIVAREIEWLDGAVSEPGWPTPAVWPSSPRRYIRLGGDPPSRRRKARKEPQPYVVDEQQLSAWFGHLRHFAARQQPNWLRDVAEHMLRWSIEANNGPPGDDQGARDNRPFSWNMEYFDFLGVLVAALPIDGARHRFLEPLTRLHDEPFYDAAAALLRGYDKATLQGFAHAETDPHGVRSIVADRLAAGRALKQLNHLMSFSVETHFGDALLAMLYQQSRFANMEMPYIPERWDGLAITMPVLAEIVAEAPNSGYLAVHFLRLIGSFPGAALVPHVARIVGLWADTHKPGSSFWQDHQIGQRICAWFEAALSTEAATADVLSAHHKPVGKCLDILIQTGIAAAQPLENRLSGL